MDMNEGEVDTCNTELTLSIGDGNFLGKAKSNEESKNKGIMNSLGLSFSMDIVSTDENTRDPYESQGDDDEDVVELVGIGMNSEKRNRTSVNSRKKLRLTRDQLCLLEETFKLQNTLNMAQKQALADRLSLQPRQIEVWFQNRRARTKLKQTEVECDFLKKCCERLSLENQRLRKEVQDLRAAARTSQSHPALFYNNNSTATTSTKPRQPLI